MKEKELALAKMLIDSLTAELLSRKVSGHVSVRTCRDMIQAKLEGQQVATRILRRILRR